MKKIMSILLIFFSIAAVAVTAHAIGPQRVGASPMLSFNGTTATCKLSVSAAASTINCTMTLYEGDTVIDSWSDCKTSYLLLSGSATVQHGHTYTLSGTGTVDGSPITITPVTRTCP